MPRLTSWRHTLSSRPSTLARRPGICTYTSRFSFGHAEQKEALQEVTHPLFGSDLWKRSWGPPTSAGLRVSQTTHNGPHRRQIFVLSYFFFFSFFFYLLLASVIRQATYRPHSSCGLVVYKAFIRCVCATSLLACTTHYIYIPQGLPVMVNFTIIAGGYTSFIATYIFNSDANVLTLAGQSQTGDNPSWIALHPTNNSIL